MVTVYGMNDKVGNVSFYDPQQDILSQNHTLKIPARERERRVIDDEVRKLIDDAYQRTLNLLTDKREQLNKLAKALLDKEILFKNRFRRIDRQTCLR